MSLEGNMRNHEEIDWIEVIYGSIFLDKAEELIRRLCRAQFARQKVEIFKSSSDTCYDDTNIVLHNTTGIPSIPVEVAASILLLTSGCNVVGISEAQFFDDEIVNVCSDLANRGVRVIVAGLDVDYKGNSLGPIPYLIVIAEYVIKVHAVRTHTGHLANYSFRKMPNDSQCMLGKSESCEPLSQAAFIRAGAEDEAQKTTNL